MQIDDSTHIHVSVEKPSQLEGIIFIRSNDIKVSVENETTDEEVEGSGREYLVASATDVLEEVQRVARWNENDEIVTETLARTNTLDNSGLPLWPSKRGQSGVNCLK